MIGRIEIGAVDPVDTAVRIAPQVDGVAVEGCDVGAAVDDSGERAGDGDQRTDALAVEWWPLGRAVLQEMMAQRVEAGVGSA